MNVVMPFSLTLELIKMHTHTVLTATSQL